MYEDSNDCAPVQRTGKPKFGMVDPDVIRDPRLSLAVKAVYSYLATFCGGPRSAFPSRQRMAAEIGVAVRTVDAALKAGSDAGLWTVQKRRHDGRQTSSLYLLHDFGGGFEARRADSALWQSAKSAPELDKPLNKTSFTSSDAFTAGGPRTSSQTDRKIFLPKDFYRWDDSGKVVQYLVSAAVAALRASGLEPREDAPARIGEALRVGIDDGASIDRLVESVRCWVEHAGTDDPNCGWLATVA